MGSKAFKGMPIPGAASILSSVIIFYYVHWDGLPGKHLTYLALTIFLALLMVSTLRHHGLKEVDFKEKKPFWMLIVFVMLLFIMLIHPSTAIFVFAMTYLSWGIIENIILLVRKQRQQKEEPPGATGVQ